jgi:two-component system LytT family response regulator
VDDERLAREEMKGLLAEFKKIAVVDEAANASEALEKIELHKPDLVFLDIQMPEKTGFDMLEDLIDVPHVIFATAYDEYAIKAFEVNALDYLLKPIERERLKTAVDKAIESIESRRSAQAEAKENKLNHGDRVFVKDGDNCWLVTLADVRLFESVGNYVRVLFGEKRPLIHKSLNALGDRLDESAFFRASRQHIVNLAWVEEVKPWFSGGLMITLRGGDKVEFSRRQAARFKDLFSL